MHCVENFGSKIQDNFFVRLSHFPAQTGFSIFFFTKKRKILKKKIGICFDIQFFVGMVVVGGEQTNFVDHTWPNDCKS